MNESKLNKAIGLILTSVVSISISTLISISSMRKYTNELLEKIDVLESSIKENDNKQEEEDSNNPEQPISKEGEDKKDRDIYTREYSSEELKNLYNQNPSLEVLKEKIHTIPDSVAYLDLSNALFYSPSFSAYDVKECIKSVFDSKVTTSIEYSIITSYLLSDDIENLSTIIAFTYVSSIDQIWPFSGISIPTDNGYTIMSPGSLSNNLNNNNCNPMLINKCNFDKNYTGINTNLKIDQSYIAISQIVTINSSVLKCDISYDANRICSSNSSSFKTIYSLSKEELNNIQKANSEKEIEANYKTICNNYKTYGIGADGYYEFISNRALYEHFATLNADQAAAEIDSINDVIGFLCFKNYKARGHDLSLYDSHNDFWWHFNCEPYTCFEHNYGCCGTTSGLVNFLLNGDCEGVGMCNMTFTQGEGGGHVINWIKENGTYYVLDFVNLVSTGYSSDGFGVTSAPTLNEACIKWMNRSPWTEQIFVTTSNATGDTPIGWGSDCYTSYFPESMKDKITIHLENPGYYVKFAKIYDDTADAIWAERSNINITGL